MIDAISNLFLIPLDGKNSIKERVAWLQRLRTYLFPCFVLLFFFGLRFHYLSASNLWIFFSAVSVFLTVFLCAKLMLDSSKDINEKHLFINIVADLFVFALFLLSSKGLANPFIYTIFIHTFIGGILLERRLSNFFLLIIHLVLFTIQLISLNDFDYVWFDVAPLLFTQHFLCFLSWAISTSLSKHLESGYKKINYLKSANERADRLRALGALSSGFSHEFASPLNTIKLKLDKINRLDTGGLFLSDLEILKKAVNKCDDTLKKMNASLFDSNNLSYQKVNIKDFIADVIMIWSQDREECAIENNVDERFELTLPIFNFTQVLLCLIDNAYEAKKSEFSLEINTLQQADFVEICFTDKGVGFSRDVLNRLGEPFNSDKEMGIGLGLFSTEIFMNSVGGHMEVENKSIGACIRLLFPISLVSKESTL